MKRQNLMALFLLLIALSSVALLWLMPSRSSPDIVILRSYRSLPQAIQGILNGEVNLLPIDKIDLQTLEPLENNTQIRLVSIPSFDFSYIGLNLRNWPLNDNSFRKALLYAFNRPAALNGTIGSFGNGLRPGLFSTAYSTLGWRLSNDTYGYDTAKAKQLLDNEGFNQSSSPFRIDPLTEEPLKTMFLASRLSQPEEVAAADLFSKDMQAVGLPIINLPMSDPDFYLALRTYTFDLFIDSQSANSAPIWLRSLFSSEMDTAPVPMGSNLVGYKNSTFDGYLTDLFTASNQNEVLRTAEKCQDVLTADLPVLPVFSKNLLLAADSWIPITKVTGSMADTLRSSVVSIVNGSSPSTPLRIGFTSYFESLDPTISSNQADWTVLHLITEPLVSTDQQGRLEPDLAQQWTISRDGTLITMSLRQDVKFYDGQTITPNDLVTTINWLISNVKSSSPLYPLITEISRADVLDQKTMKISLSRPDRFAINSFTNLFALPSSRLINNPFTEDPLESQMLLSSGPLTVREFTQTDGVYLRLNNPYFGKSTQDLANIDAFEGVKAYGTNILPGNEIKISSPPIILDNQPVTNASYKACIYGQIVMQCSAGKYMGDGSYSAIFHVDSRLPVGTYRVEDSLYAMVPNGTLTILDTKNLTIRTFPLSAIVILSVLAVAILLTFRKRMRLALPRRRPTRRRLTRKRRPRRRIVRRTRRP